MFSAGKRSGLFSLLSTWTLLLQCNAVARNAVCGLALSWWNIPGFPWKNMSNYVALKPVNTFPHWWRLLTYEKFHRHYCTLRTEQFSTLPKDHNGHLRAEISPDSLSVLMILCSGDVEIYSIYSLPNFILRNIILKVLHNLQTQFFVDLWNSLWSYLFIPVHVTDLWPVNLIFFLIKCFFGFFFTSKLRIFRIQNMS